MTVGEEYPIQQQRCRDLLDVYKSLGPIGTFGHMVISQVLQRADQAAISGDLPAMLRSLQEMRGCD
jgi:hypothetical protein